MAFADTKKQAQDGAKVYKEINKICCFINIILSLLAASVV
jgi:hypothetical protein